MLLRLKFVVYFCLLSEIFAGNLVKTPDGNGLFITGRGCGGSTKIRYLNYVPENLDKHECTFINLKHSEPPSERIDLADCRIGDGLGGTETKLSGTFDTKESCIIAVKKLYPSANGATIKIGCVGSEICPCYAEFGMNSWSSIDIRYMSCMFNNIVHH